MEKMEWFLVEGLEKKEALVAARVPVTEITVAQPRTITGLAFPKEERERVLGVLGLGSRLVEVQTDQEGIIFLEAEASQAPRTATIKVDDRSQYRCDHWKDFASAVQKWAAGLRIAVTEEITLGFCVKGPNEASDLCHPHPPGLVLIIGQKTWGGYVSDLFSDSDEDDVEYIPGGRFIRVFGLPECPSANDIKKTIAAFEKFLPLALAKKAEVEEMLKAAAIERRRKSRERYMTECAKRLDKVLRETESKISAGEQEVEQLQQKIARVVRETIGAGRKLEQIKASKPAALETFGQEFDKLLQVPHVVNVQVADGVIKVFTDRIYIVHDGVTYDIGDFRVEIYTNGAVRFFNLTNHGKGPGANPPDGFDGNTSFNRHHPHVKADGNPCLGNIQEAIPQLIGEHQYSVVAILAIQFLQSVNIDDSAGVGIKWWPKAA